MPERARLPVLRPGRRAGARALQAAIVACALLLLAATPAQVHAATPAAAGQVYAFGANYFGQLGVALGSGTDEVEPTPTLVAFPGALGAVTQLATGSASLAVTASGQLYSFGDNQYGQLGSTTNNGVDTPNPTPTLVTLPGESGPVTQVAAGSYQSLVVTAGGQLYAFGNNYFGQLGNAENNGAVNKANPTPTLVTLPGATGGITQAAAGAEFSLAVTSTGQLYAFGDNQYGQLGITTGSGSLNANPTPTLVTLPGATGGVTQVAAGVFHSLAVTSTGQLYAFGENGYGQLGNEVGNGEFSRANPTPTLVTLPGAIGPVTQVAAGVEQSLVVTASGQLYAFGENDYGQLGVARNSATHNANPTPTLVTLPGAGGGVTQVSAGGPSSLALTSSGQLYGFGDNYSGQLGTTTNNGMETANPTPTLVPLPAGTTIDTIARGPEAFQSLALVADLTVTSTSLSAGHIHSPYSSAVQAAGGTPPYTWSASGLSTGLFINPVSGVISGTATTTGTNNVTLTVTDADGVTASSSLQLAIDEPSCGCVEITHPLTITSASLSNKRFRVGKEATAISAHKIPRGTTFRFTLSAPAQLQIVITRASPGLRHGRSCVAPSARLRRAHAKHCTRTLTVGTLKRAHESSGAGHISFSGRVGRRALRPGSYRAVLTASNEEVLRSKPVTLSFTIIA